MGLAGRRVEAQGSPHVRVVVPDCAGSPFGDDAFRAMLRLELALARLGEARVTATPSGADDAAIAARVEVPSCEEGTRITLRVWTGGSSQPARYDLDVSEVHRELRARAMALAIAERLRFVEAEVEGEVQAPEPAAGADGGSGAAAASAAVGRPQREGSPSPPADAPVAAPRTAVQAWLAPEATAFPRDGSWFVGGRVGVLIGPHASGAWRLGVDLGPSFAWRTTPSGRAEVWLADVGVALGVEVPVEGTALSVAVLALASGGASVARGQPNGGSSQVEVGGVASVGAWVRARLELGSRVSAFVDLVLRGMVLGGRIAPPDPDGPPPGDQPPLGWRVIGTGLRVGMSFP